MFESIKNGSHTAVEGGKVAIEWLWRIMAFIAIPVMLYLATAINRLDATVTALQVNVAEIRGNRFTSGDGLEVWQAIADIRAIDSQHTVQIQELRRRADRCEEGLQQD
jgi:hypothetical protein